LPILSVENVEKVYDETGAGVAALRGVTFQLARGDFVALMGPSGCGKSTLLHVIGAVDAPTSGRVILDGLDYATLSDDDLARLRRRRIGFVFQFFNLLPTLTVAENVGLPLLLEGEGEKSIREKALRLLKRVGLDGRAGHFPAQLSGGEMQRAAVARAVIAEPELLLADEPTGNLDSVSGDEVMTLLAELNHDLGVTIIVATHSSEAARFAGATIRLRDGRLEGDGSGVLEAE
jgi:putative ABC transport system ATP-binding protein